MASTDKQTLSAANPAAEPLPRQIGRYRILGRLGAGGMGTVYRAEDPELHRIVALKLPRFDGPPQSVVVRVQRFQREAQAAAGIRHPHVCPIYDVGEHEGQPYVVMAFIEGESLAERLTRRGRYENPVQAVQIVRQILDALEVVHDHGIIHRDLKPSNILFDAGDHAILTDFGLARRTDDGAGLTSEGMVVGTPAYMAPEQADGRLQSVGPWTDLYSLGVILYQMLTGRLPFEGPPLKVMAEIIHARAPSPSLFRPDLDPGLCAIIRKATAPTVQERNQNAREFNRALAGWASSITAVTASQVPVVHLMYLKHGVRWSIAKMWRHWRVLVCALVCLLLGGGIGYGFRSPGASKPLHVGYVQGDIQLREANGIATEKCNGFKVECYDTFVVIYVDRKKEPTWTDNYVLTIPWSKIESLTLQPAAGAPK